MKGFVIGFSLFVSVALSAPVEDRSVTVGARDHVSLPLLSKYQEKVPPPPLSTDSAERNADGSMIFPMLNTAKKACSPEVAALALNFAGTDAGVQASCPRVVEAVQKGAQPLLADACKCTAALVASVNDEYDNRFDCVIGPVKDIWNIRLTHRYCRLRDMAAKEVAEGEAISKTTTIDDKPQVCTETTCTRGECVPIATGAQCKCPPGFAGSRCEREACPNDCSGWGICDLAAGKCRCDSTHVGIDCSRVHPETLQTEHGRVAEGREGDAAKEVKIVGGCLEEYARIQKQLTKFRDYSLHLPRCFDDGRYYKRQCHRYTYDCWCVTEIQGKEVVNSRRKPGYKPPDCERLDAGGMEFDFEPVEVPDHDACSKAGRFCFEGFCNPDASGGPACQCVNGYAGEFCDEPPENPVDWDSMSNRTLPPGQQSH